MRLLLICSILVSSAFADTCKDLYQTRGESKDKFLAAMTCYQDKLAQASETNERAHVLGQISYLHFFDAEFYQDKKIPSILKSMKTAKKSVLLFGKLYDVKHYKTLDSTSKTILARALYNYGTSVARYVDLKGKLEAIKRMKDIKKSMKAIISIGMEETAYYGAHRTLAILYFKAPKIAGGDKKKSGRFFELVIKKTAFKGILSYYPVNNLMYAEYYFSVRKKLSACLQLAAIRQMEMSDLTAMKNDLYYETVKDIDKANSLYVRKNCRSFEL